MNDANVDVPQRVLLASFPDYAGAQETVDRLSDKGFPVENVSIVGWDLRLEERVTGRMTNWRAAGYGALGGAWFGLLLGLLFGFFTPAPASLWLLLWGPVLGAVWGAIFGFLSHWAWGGRRDFGSVKHLDAERWDVMVAPSLLSRAQTDLADVRTEPAKAK